MFTSLRNKIPSNIWAIFFPEIGRRLEPQDYQEI